MAGLKSLMSQLERLLFVVEGKDRGVRCANRHGMCCVVSQGDLPSDGLRSCGALEGDDFEPGELFGSFGEELDAVRVELYLIDGVQILGAGNEDVVAEIDG